MLNLSAESINTTPIRYGLHLSFTDKNKYVAVELDKRNVAIELETLARVLHGYVTSREKESVHQ